MSDLVSFISWKHITSITGIFFFVLFHFLIEPVRWSVYMKTKNKEQGLNFLYIFSATAFFSYIMPAKLGIPIRFWLIKKHQQLKTSSIGLFILVEQAFGLGSWTIASLLLGGSFAIAILQQNLNRVKGWLSPSVVWGLAIVAIVLLTVSWRKRSRMIRGGRAIFSSLSLIQIGVIAGLFTLDITSYTVRHFFILQLLGENSLPFSVVASVAVLSIYAGFVSAMPMGLVGYDATIVFLLVQQGVDLQTAVLVPVINRVANLLVSILLGIPSAYKLGISLNIHALVKKARGSEYVP
ncbi:MAG: lysylphosphatidylglycerol synthase domain-containing protein [Saprospiraceae bacterium]